MGRGQRVIKSTVEARFGYCIKNKTQKGDELHNKVVWGRRQRWVLDHRAANNGNRARICLDLALNSTPSRRNEQTFLIH